MLIMDDPVTLTWEGLHALGTNGCGFNSHQLALLGVKEKKSGWLRKLVGTQISRATYDELTKLTGLTREKRRDLGYAKIKISEPNSPPRRDPMRAAKKRVNQQYRHLRTCMDAGELIAAEDHAQAILAEIRKLH